VEVDRHKRPSVGDIVKNLNETETMIHRSSQFSHRSGHDDRGSSTDQVSRLVERMGISVEPFQVPHFSFSPVTMQQYLKAIMEGSIDEAWTYAIHWQSSSDSITGSSCLSWGDGYYKGCDEDEKGPRKHQPTTPAVQAEQEHRKRVLRELDSLIKEQNTNSAPTPYSREEEVSDELWSNLMSVVQSFVDSSRVTSQEQEHRKHVLHKLSSLLSGYSTACSSSKDPAYEDVTDTEWFFLVSMTQSFSTGSGLPGKALLAARPIWITTALSDAPCERARQSYAFGLRTMVCVPIGTGVLELGSTKFIFQTTESIPRILSFFNQYATEIVD